MRIFGRRCVLCHTPGYISCCMASLCKPSCRWQLSGGCCIQQEGFSWIFPVVGDVKWGMVVGWDCLFVEAVTMVAGGLGLLV